MRPFILLLFLAPTISACVKKRENQTIQYLTAGNAKYWAEVMPYPVKKYMGLRFDLSGRCDRYSENMTDGKSKIRVKFASYDYSPKWAIIDDSTLNVVGLGKVRVEYLDENVMVLNQMQFKKTIVYLKAKDQSTELVVDTFGPSLRM
ncbi:hypothetical protein [Hymenobacter ruricola]|nr:hypothetical protein [Hymenobacter ruricola]